MRAPHPVADAGRVRARPVTGFAPLIGIAAACVAGAELAVIPCAS
jgi:hypothetical protein